MKNLYKKTIAVFLLTVLTTTAFSQYNNALRFKITGNGYTDETIIRLVDDATEDFDGMYDAWKFFSPNPNVPSIYTQIEPGEELSINSLPEFEEDVSITLFTNTPISGTYTIDIEEVFALSSNYKVSLTDVSSNSHYRLLGDTALTFTIDASQNSPTFTFNISTSAIVTVIDESCATKNDGVLTISNPGNTDWLVEIVDDLNNEVVNSVSNMDVNNYNNLTAGNYSATISSKGIVEEYTFTINPGVEVTADFEMDSDELFLEEGGAVLTLFNNSSNTDNITWSFGDGGTSTDINPEYTYLEAGVYDVTLSNNSGNCYVENTQQVTVIRPSTLNPAGGIATSIQNINEGDSFLANYGSGNYNITTTDYSDKEIRVFDLTGKVVFQDNYTNNSYNFSLTNNASGVYVAVVTMSEGDVFQTKLYR